MFECVQTLTLFCALVPFADSSDAVHMRTDLSTAERELCEQTALLAAFVDQLMDRCSRMHSCVYKYCLGCLRWSSRQRAGIKRQRRGMLTVGVSIHLYVS
jgi:hypothetical protein